MSVHHGVYTMHIVLYFLKIVPGYLYYGLLRLW